MLRQDSDQKRLLFQASLRYLKEVRRWTREVLHTNDIARLPPPDTEHWKEEFALFAARKARHVSVCSCCRHGKVSPV